MAQPQPRRRGAGYLAWYKFFLYGVRRQSEAATALWLLAKPMGFEVSLRPIACLETTSSALRAKPKRCRAALATAVHIGLAYGVRRQSGAATALWLSLDVWSAMA